MRGSQYYTVCTLLNGNGLQYWDVFYLSFVRIDPNNPAWNWLVKRPLFSFFWKNGPVYPVQVAFNLDLLCEFVCLVDAVCVLDSTELNEHPQRLNTMLRLSILLKRISSMAIANDCATGREMLHTKNQSKHIYTTTRQEIGFTNRLNLKSRIPNIPLTKHTILLHHGLCIKQQNPGTKFWLVTPRYQLVTSQQRLGILFAF